MTLLLRYPSPQAHPPSTFVRDALYLEKNPTPGRGRFIISKYSGRAPEQKFHHHDADRYSSGLKLPLRRRSRDIGNVSAEGGGGPKNLENILQDVSEGIQSWGVAKAVRGAVTEAKKNMQSMHTEKGIGFPPSGHAAATGKPSPRKARRYAEFEPKAVDRMEERNKILASGLNDAVNDLLQSLVKSGALEGDEKIPITEAITKVQSVQSCLEDSTVPVDPPSQTWVEKSAGDNTSEQKEQPAPRKEEIDPMGHPAKPNADASSSFMAPNSTNDARELGAHDRSAPPRAKLADSEFSWMLEGGRQLSEFVDSSIPPERARQNSSSNRTNPLFGGAGDQGDQKGAEFDDLAMNSLRGPKGRK